MGSVSVVLPTLNEAGNVGPLLEGLAAALGGGVEVVLVDDGSTDGTVDEAVREAGRLGLALKVLERGRRLGLSSAVVDGIKAAGGDVVVVMDADLQHPPEVVPRLVAAVEAGWDAAVASRYVEGGGVGDWPLIRRAVSRGATFLAHLLLPSTRGVRDPMSGFFAVRRSKVVNCLRARGEYKVLLDVLLCVEKVREVPYVFGRRRAGESKLGLAQVLDYVRQVTATSLALLSLSGYRPLKFAAVGVLGVLVSEAVLHVAWRLIGIPYFASLIPAIEAGIINNYSINRAWTFRDRPTPYAAGLARYHVAGLGGTLVNYAASDALHYVLGLNGYLAYIVGVLLGFLVNYVLAESYVFKNSQTAPAQQSLGPPPHRLTALWDRLESTF
ncbi:dolichol-phosphate mannosyltransferase [Thermocladium modestius]|uniref:Dolichol-phosphate mannosyltransferase n=1 Tax=Thermocladium modestius TaxID=62609 RepID=A0A830GUI7_9CREN|nr:glycosyltransferase family 2 protein [Thermocladium modestius]GGP19809.1 dolichol-phosphate mannosyltransferase [Thermocladium modestius]